MRLFSTVIALLLCFGGSAFAQPVPRPCDKMVPFSYDGPTTVREIVPAVAGARIYFCGFTLLQKGNTLDFRITIGKGTACGTDTQYMTPQLQLPSDVQITTRAEMVAQSTEPGFALCLEAPGASGSKLGGMIYYAQF